MVLVVVKLEGFFRHIRLKRFVIVGKGWQFEGHFALLFSLVNLAGTRQQDVRMAHHPLINTGSLVNVT